MPSFRSSISMLAFAFLLSFSSMIDAKDIDNEHRSPTDIALSPDGKWLVTANETSSTVSLVRTADGKLADEITVGLHPSCVEFTPALNRCLVTSSWAGTISVLSCENGRLETEGVIDVGFEPCGIAIMPDGDRAYIGLNAAKQIVELDLDEMKVLRRIDVGNWPRYLTLTPDGSRLAVGCSGDADVYVIDTQTAEPLYDEPLSGGINLGHMTSDKNGQHAYFTWMVYRTNPLTVSNIRRGWILASRIGRVRLDGSAYREAISLDVPGLAIADPHGIGITPDGNRLVASASGTHELLVYRLPDLPFVSTGGPGDLIDRRLENDRDRFDRIPLGGRPMGLEMSGDSRTVYVANYLRDSIQYVDIKSKQVTHEVQLGRPSELSIARKGMAIFYDGTRSLDQWYSCHTCHQDGGTNSRAMDTWNDGTEMTLKTVLPLYAINSTMPWTWHGWQEDLDDAMHKSFTSTMQGKAPSEEDTRALIAFLDTLQPPPNPFARNKESHEELTQRGKLLFESNRTACADCHSGPYFTDGQVHEVGSGSKSDAYVGYNTPSLLGTYRKVRWLHSGRAKSLERVLGDLHSPEKVSGLPNLDDGEIAALIAYLKTL